MSVGFAQGQAGSVTGRASLRRSGPLPGPTVVDAMGTDSADDDHRQTRQQPGQARSVVAGISDDEDIGIACPVVAGPGESVGDGPQLTGCEECGVIVGAEASGVEDRRPRGLASFQGCHEGVGPSRDHIGVAAPTGVRTYGRRTGSGSSPRPGATSSTRRRPARSAFCRRDRAP